MGPGTTPEEELRQQLEALGQKAVVTAPTEGGAEEAAVKAQDQDFSTPVTLRNLFTHQDTHPTVLDFAMLKSFGAEWVEWDAETLWQEIERVFNAKVSSTNRSKLRSVQVLHRQDLPWTSWHVFEKIIQALNGTPPNFEVMQIPTLEYLYAGVDMMDSFRKERPFSDEVRLYMAGVVLHENVFFVPAPLDFIQLEVSQPLYRCKDCGQAESALYHDGYCSHCTDRMHPSQGLSMAPKREPMAAGKGQNIVVEVTHDPAPISKRWSELKGLPHVKMDLDKESAADIQCAKLVLARDYMNIRRKQLAEQLTTLKGWMGTV
jgi:hypothetical protein